MISNDNSIGPLVGWVICRLKQDREESSEKKSSGSLSHHIVDLAYGSLSQADFPPISSWIFLAKEKRLTIVAQYFTDEQIEAASEAIIRVERFRRKNDAYGADLVIDNVVRGVLVSGCPIQELNGSYLENGSHNGVPMYTHVRQWCIMRMELPELPELGISAEDTIRMEQEGGNAKFVYKKADDSFTKIVEPMSEIREGSSNFTRMYIDIARAGNKMVIEDQTLLKLHNNALRSSLLDKNSSQLLKTLAAYTLDSRANSAPNVEVNRELLDSLEFPDPRITQLLAQSSSLPIESAEAEKPKLTSTAYAARGTQYDDETLITEQLLTKNVSYQAAPRNQVHQLPSDDPHSQEHIRGSDDFVFGAEAELAEEVIATINVREAALSSLLSAAIAINSRYLAGAINDLIGFESLSEPLQKLRDATLGYFNAFSVWQRVSKKRRKHEKDVVDDRNAILFGNERDERSFSVVIAYNSVHNLYGSSEAVNSTVSKKFTRNFEPAVKKKELKFVGEFKTRDEAVAALEEALREIPEEQRLQQDKTAQSKAIVAFRACKKHYLVRTSGVDANIPCELCAAAKATKKVTKVAGSDTDLLAFPWRAVDYNEKLRTDLSPLDELEVISKARRNCQSAGRSMLRFIDNPLLLDDSFLEQAGRVLRSSRCKALLLEMEKDDSFSNTSTLGSLTGAFRPGITYTAPSGPINNSKGKMELLHDALAFSRTYQHQEKVKAKMAPYLTMPYNKKQGSKQSQFDSVESDERKKRKEESERTIQDELFTLQMHIASLTVPAPPELLKRILQTIPLTYDIYKLRPKSAILQPINQETKSEQDLNGPSMDLNAQWSMSAPATAASTLQYTTGQLLATNASMASASSQQWGRSTALVTSQSAGSLLQKDRSVNFRGERTVLAQIGDVGAMMKVPQERFPPAYREEDKFCRTDVGEWAGMTNGRAVRSFNFHDNLLKEGKERERVRKQIQMQLRRAIAPDKNIVDCNVAEVEALIAAARSIRGSILNLDIINAENYLRRRIDMIAWSNHMQSIFRGNRDRKLYREIRSTLIEGHKKKVILAQLAAEWSNTISFDVLQKGVKSETKRRLQDRYRCVVNLSGILAVATVVRASRAFRGPMDTEPICPSCGQSGEGAAIPSRRYNAHHQKKKEREEDSAFAAAGRAPTAKKTIRPPSASTSTNKTLASPQSPLLRKGTGKKAAATISKYDPSESEEAVNAPHENDHFTTDHSEYRFPTRTVCSCPIKMETERWHVRFHFPLSCIEDVREFAIEQVVNVLHQLQNALGLYKEGFEIQQTRQQRRLHSRRSQAASSRSFSSQIRSRPTSRAVSLYLDEDKAAESSSFGDFSLFQRTFRPLLRGPEMTESEILISSPKIASPGSPVSFRSSALSEDDIEDLSEAGDELSWSKAYVKAGLESAAALRLLSAPSLPPAVLDVVRSNDGQTSLHPLLLTAADGGVSDGRFPDRGHVTLPEYNDIHMSDAVALAMPKALWQPFATLDAARMQYRTAKRRQDLVLQTQSDTVESLQVAEFEFVLQTTRREEETMTFEDVRSKLCRLQEQYEKECRHNAYVMARSKELFESVDAMEKQLKPDDLRSYDKEESSSLWKTMHRKGEIENEIQELLPHLSVARKHRDMATKHCEKVKAKLQVCIRIMNQQKSSEENAASEVERCHQNLRQLQLELSMSAKQFARAFSKPRRLRISYAEVLRDRTIRYDANGRTTSRDRSLPGDRRLQIVPHNLVLVRDANLRLQPENRKLLSGLCRRIMAIVPIPHQHFLFADASVFASRCMISCFIDDLTGTMVIHLTDASLYAHDAPGIETAEAIQHEDFHLESTVLSYLATATQRYEISLTAEEVDYLIAKYDKVQCSLAADTTDISTLVSHISSFGIAPMTTSCVVNSLSQEDPLQLKQELCAAATISSAEQFSSVLTTEPRVKNNYLQRFENREQKAVTVAEKLVSLLRLQPFTQRPCLGDLAFHRRMKFIHTVIGRSAWLRDLLSSRPTSVITAQLSQPMFVTLVQVGPNQRLQCRIWQHLDRFELHFENLDANQLEYRTTRIVLTAQQILQRLQFSTIDMMTWIGMMTLNRYDISAVFDGLLSALVPRLPGMLPWRGKLYSEFPVIHFDPLSLRQSSRLSEKTFRRVTSCHRFVSGKFCMVVCSVSGEIRASGIHSQNWSMSIAIHPPIEQKFLKHCYQEKEALVLTISRAELVAFLLQQLQVLIKLHTQAVLLGVSCFAPSSQSAQKQKMKLLAAARDQVTDAVQRCFSLLHSLAFDKLFHHLLDSIDLPATAQIDGKSGVQLLAIPTGALRYFPGDFSESFLQENQIDIAANKYLVDDIQQNIFNVAADEGAAMGALHCGLEIQVDALGSFMKRTLKQHIHWIENRFPIRSKTLGLNILQQSLVDMENNPISASVEFGSTQNTSPASTYPAQATGKNEESQTATMIQRKGRVVDAAAALNVAAWPAHAAAALTTHVPRKKNLTDAMITIAKAEQALIKESIFVSEARRRSSMAAFDLPSTDIEIPIGQSTALEAETSSSSGQQIVLHSVLWKFPHHADLSVHIDESRPRNRDEDNEDTILARVVIRSTPTLGALWIDVENARPEEMEPETALKELHAMDYEDDRSAKLRQYGLLLSSNFASNHSLHQNAVDSFPLSEAQRQGITEVVQAESLVSQQLQLHWRRHQDDRLAPVAKFFIKLFRSFTSSHFDSSFLDGTDNCMSSDHEASLVNVHVEFVPLNSRSLEVFAPQLTRKMFIAPEHRQFGQQNADGTSVSTVKSCLGYRDHTIWQRANLGLVDRRMYLREQRQIERDAFFKSQHEQAERTNDHPSEVVWEWKQETRAMTRILNRAMCIREVHVCFRQENADASSFSSTGSNNCSIVVLLQVMDIVSDESWTIRLSSSLSCPSVDDDATVLLVLKEKLDLLFQPIMLFVKASAALEQMLGPPVEVRSVAAAPQSSSQITASDTNNTHEDGSIIAPDEESCAVATKGTNTLDTVSTTERSVQSGNGSNCFNSLSVDVTLLSDDADINIKNNQVLDASKLLNDADIVATEYNVNRLVMQHRKYYQSKQRRCAKASSTLFLSKANRSTDVQEILPVASTDTQELLEQAAAADSAPTGRKQRRRSAVVASKKKQQQQHKDTEELLQQNVSDMEDLYDVPWQSAYWDPAKREQAKKCKLIVVSLPLELMEEHRVRFVRAECVQRKCLKFLQQLNDAKGERVEHGFWERDILPGIIIYSWKLVSKPNENARDLSRLSALARRLLLRQQQRINERFLAVIGRLPTALSQLSRSRIDELAQREGVLLVQRNVRRESDRLHLLGALNESIDVLALTQENRRRNAGREREGLLQHQRLLRAVALRLGAVLHDALRLVFHSTLHVPARLRRLHVDLRRYTLAVQLLRACERSLVTHRARRMNDSTKHHRRADAQLAHSQAKCGDGDDNNDDVDYDDELEDIMRRVLDVDHFLSVRMQSTQVDARATTTGAEITPLLDQFPTEEAVDDILEPFSIANFAEHEIAAVEDARGSDELSECLHTEDCLHLLQSMLQQETNPALGRALDENERQFELSCPPSAEMERNGLRRLSWRDRRWLRKMLHPIHILCAAVSIHCEGGSSQQHSLIEACSLPLAQCQFPGCRSCRVSHRCRYADPSITPGDNFGIAAGGSRASGNGYRIWYEQVVQPWILCTAFAPATSHHLSRHWTSGLLPPTLNLDLHRITHGVRPPLTIAREEMLEFFDHKAVVDHATREAYLHREYRDTLLTTQCLLALRYLLRDVHMSQQQPVHDTSSYSVVPTNPDTRVLESLMLKDTGLTSFASQWLSITAIRTLGGRFGLRMIHHLRQLLRCLYLQSQQPSLDQESADVAADAARMGSLWKDLSKALRLVYPTKRQRKQLDATAGIVGLDVDVGSALRNSVADASVLVLKSRQESIHGMVGGRTEGQKASMMRMSMSALGFALRKSQASLRVSIAQRTHVSGTESSRPNTDGAVSMAPKEDSSTVAMQTASHLASPAYLLRCESDRVPLEHVQALTRYQTAIFSSSSSSSSSSVAAAVSSLTFGMNLNSFAVDVVYREKSFAFLFLPLLRLSPKPNVISSTAGSEDASLGPIIVEKYPQHQQQQQKQHHTDTDTGTSDVQLDPNPNLLLHRQDSMEGSSLLECPVVDLGLRARMISLPSRVKSATKASSDADGNSPKFESEESSLIENAQSLPSYAIDAAGGLSRNLDCRLSLDRLLYEGCFVFSNFKKSAGLGNNTTEIVMIAQITFGRWVPGAQQHEDKDNDEDDQDNIHINILSAQEREELNDAAYHLSREQVSEDDLLSGRLQTGSERYLSCTDGLNLVDGVTVTVYDSHSNVHSKPMGVDATTLESFVLSTVEGRRLLHREDRLRPHWSFDCYRLAARLLFESLPRLLHCTFIHGRCISMSLQLQPDVVASNVDTKVSTTEGASSTPVHATQSPTRPFAERVQIKKHKGRQYSILVPQRTQKNILEYLTSVPS